MTNPKDSIGRSKPGFSLLPLAVLYEVIVVLRLGAKKYGPWNWRSAKVNETVYVDAAIRHLTQYLAGEDLDDESGVPHITHAITGLLILRDAQKHSCSVDDREVTHRLRLNEVIERISAIESPTVEAVDTGASDRDNATIDAAHPVNQDDVGRKFMNRQGQVVEIESVDDRRFYAKGFIYHLDGRCPGVPSADAVRFATPEQVSPPAVSHPEITISSRDIGRWLTCRNGGRAQITGFTGGEDRYPVEVRDESGFLTMHTLHGLRDAAEESDLDLVAFEPDRPFHITKADVGRKVKNRLGKVGQILGTEDKSLGPYPVRVRFSHGDELYTTEGRYIATFKFTQDLVEFASEPEPEFRITADDIGRKVISECGDTWTITHFTDDGSYQVRATKGEAGTGESFTVEGYLYTYNLPESKHNLVEFVDEPVFKITEADIGRRIRSEEGAIWTITEISDSRLYPVVAVREGGEEEEFTPEGYYYVGNHPESRNTLVEFVDLDITSNDNGRYGRIARGNLVQITNGGGRYRSLDDNLRIYIDRRGVANVEPALYTVVQLADPVDEDHPLTPDDIGCQVVLRGGGTDTLTKYEKDVVYPYRSEGRCWLLSGSWMVGSRNNPRDIVAIFREAK